MYDVAENTLPTEVWFKVACLLSVQSCSWSPATSTSDMPSVGLREHILGLTVLPTPYLWACCVIPGPKPSSPTADQDICSSTAWTLIHSCIMWVSVSVGVWMCGMGCMCAQVHASVYVYVHVCGCVCVLHLPACLCAHAHVCECRWIQDLRSLYYLISEKLCLWLNLYHVTMDGATHCFLLLLF